MTLFAQQADSTFHQKYHIPVKAIHITTDKLRQSYITTAKNELIKYDSEGKELFRYNNNRLGPLADVDATNPFNILLYYPEYLRVIILDRTLSPTTEFNLYDLEVTDVQAVGLSNDNNIWYYDDRSFKLRKINQLGKALQESQNLSLVLNKSIRPNQIIERNNRVYVNDQEAGILVFDLFGSYIKSIPIFGLDHFDLVEQQLFYEVEGHLHIFHLQSLQSHQIQLPVKLQKNKGISIQPHLLFVVLEEELSVYSF